MVRAFLQIYMQHTNSAVHLIRGRNFYEKKLIKATSICNIILKMSDNFIRKLKKIGILIHLLFYSFTDYPLLQYYAQFIVLLNGGSSLRKLRQV